MFPVHDKDGNLVAVFADEMRAVAYKAILDLNTKWTMSAVSDPGCRCGCNRSTCAVCCKPPVKSVIEDIAKRKQALVADMDARAEALWVDTEIPECFKKKPMPELVPAGRLASEANERGVCHQCGGNLGKGPQYYEGILFCSPQCVYKFSAGKPIPEAVARAVDQLEGDALMQFFKGK